MAGRICKHDGCGLPVAARNMCSTHWKRWAKANPETRQHLTILKAVVDALPGRQRNIVRDTGLCNETVKNALEELFEQGKAHISHFLPPTTRGTQWAPVWDEGKGVHAKLTKQMRLEQRRKTTREWHARTNSRAATSMWFKSSGQAAP